jgi:diacylglycerol O-acyltransferase
MKVLSPTDSAFLWMETRNQPMHVAGLNIYSPPPGAGPHFVSQLLAGWGRHLSALPPFNQRPVLRRGLWYWEDDTEFELDYHLRHLALPHPGRIRELLAMIFALAWQPAGPQPPAVGGLRHRRAAAGPVCDLHQDPSRRSWTA